MLKNLYPDRTVRLVDGGVHDNQGVVGLLEQDCTVLLVSDASGQMESEPNPSKGEMGVLLRSNSILQARIREAEFDDVKARRRSSLLRGLMFLHLKKDLDADPVDWVDTEDPYGASEEARPASRRGPVTSYGIQKDVQRLLAGLRTDLDSFTDAEAYALMTSGYRMTEHSFPRCIDGFPVQQQAHDWPFLSIEKPMTQNEGSKKLKRLLEAGANIPFKIWKLSTPLRYTSYLLGVLMIVGFFWAMWHCRNAEVFIWRWVGSFVALTLVAMLLKKVFGDRVGATIIRVARYKETLKRIAIGLGMGLVGWLVAWIHLGIFDKLFLKWGKVEHILNSD